MRSNAAACRRNFRFNRARSFGFNAEKPSLAILLEKPAKIPGS